MNAHPDLSAAAPGLTRRSALGLLGMSGLGAVLAACSSASGDDGGSHGDTGAATGGLHLRVQKFTAGTASAIRPSIIDRYRLQARDGVALRYSGGSSFTSTIEPLVANIVDAAEYGPINTTNDNLKGHDVVMVGPSLLNHGRWLVPASSTARSIKDLRGKRVGVQPSSSNTYQAAQLAAAVNGLDFAEDFKLFPGEPIASLALFKRGDLDAIIAIEPNATRVVAQGARQLATVSDLWQEGTGDDSPLLLQGVGVRRSWIATDRNRRAAAAWVRMLTDINRRIRADPQLLAQYHAVYGVPAAEKAAIALLPERLPQIYAVDWNATTFANIDKQISVARKLGLIAGTASGKVYRTLT